MAEFQQILADPEKLQQVTKAIFDQVDDDGSGFIEQAELVRAIRSIPLGKDCPAPSENDILEAYQQLDANGDGKVSLSEFQPLVRQILETLAQM